MGVSEDERGSRTVGCLIGRARGGVGGLEAGGGEDERLMRKWDSPAGRRCARCQGCLRGIQGVVVELVGVREGERDLNGTWKWSGWSGWMDGRTVNRVDGRSVLLGGVKLNHRIRHIFGLD